MERRSAIEAMLDRNVEWTDLPEPEDKQGLYAVKQGVLEFGILRLRCYVLNDGQRVFEADDIGRFMAGEGAE